MSIIGQECVDRKSAYSRLVHETLETRVLLNADTPFGFQEHRLDIPVANQETVAPLLASSGVGSISAKHETAISPPAYAVRYEVTTVDRNDLGFEVRLTQDRVLRRSSYSGLSDCKRKLFAVIDDRKDHQLCRKALASELALTPDAKAVLESGWQDPGFEPHEL